MPVAPVTSTRTPRHGRLSTLCTLGLKITVVAYELLPIILARPRPDVAVRFPFNEADRKALNRTSQVSLMGSAKNSPSKRGDVSAVRQSECA